MRYRSRVLAAVLGLASVFVLACSGEPSPAARPTGTAETAVATATTAPVAASPRPVLTPVRTVSSNARPFSESQRETALEILEKLGEVRGTPSRNPADTYVISRNGAIEDYQSSITDEDRELLGIQSRVYGLLGLVPDGTDYLETLLGLLRLGILGYYDPDLDAFFLLDDLGGLSSQTSLSTIVHEFAHALQDEYHDINALYEARENDWDAAMAMTHVIEGNAVASEGAYFGSAVRPRPSCFQLPGFSRSNPPYTIVRELNSWYDDGLCFVQAVAPEVSDQEALFTKPPLSTEHIFHPEKYEAYEPVIPVTLPSLAGTLGSGWTQTLSSTLGEFTLQNLLIQGLSTDRNRVWNAAAGWGGDRWALYENGDDRLIHVSIAWDTEADAAEFWSAVLDSLDGRGGTEIASAETSTLRTVEGKHWRLERDGARVSFIVSDNAGDAQRVAPAAGLP